MHAARVSLGNMERARTRVDGVGGGLAGVKILALTSRASYEANVRDGRVTEASLNLAREQGACVRVRIRAFGVCFEKWRLTGVSERLCTHYCTIADRVKPPGSCVMSARICRNLQRSASFGENLALWCRRAEAPKRCSLEFSSVL